MNIFVLFFVRKFEINLKCISRYYFDVINLIDFGLILNFSTHDQTCEIVNFTSASEKAKFHTLNFSFNLKA